MYRWSPWLSFTKSNKICETVNARQTSNLIDRTLPERQPRWLPKPYNGPSRQRMTDNASISCDKQISNSVRCNAQGNPER